MRYYFLTIKDGERNADHWIKEQKFAPFFYGMATLEALRDDTAPEVPTRSWALVRRFFKTFDNRINEGAVIVSIGTENVYLYKQTSPLRQHGVEREKRYNGFDVEIIKAIPKKDCPFVLVSIRSNQRIGRKTFSEITEEKHFGNCRAIDYVLSGKKQRVDNFQQYLQCLSSVQFETLIAKMLEEQGYWVSAYTGGTLPRYDFFCEKGNKKMALQVKTHLSKEVYERYEKESGIDYYYCITSGVTTKKIKSSSDIEGELTDCGKTKEWLAKTLWWVTYK
ncbi:MAG: hypothetical protein LBR23_02700 [Spirochaetaceae bacterium]|jgi:hypothetical protein|nr:hypothetical protein [Spirochaetaceae bacterium]